MERSWIRRPTSNHSAINSITGEVYQEGGVNPKTKRRIPKQIDHWKTQIGKSNNWANIELSCQFYGSS